MQGSLLQKTLAWVSFVGISLWLLLDLATRHFQFMPAVVFMRYMNPIAAVLAATGCYCVVTSREKSVAFKVFSVVVFGLAFLLTAIMAVYAWLRPHEIGDLNGW